MSAPSSTPTPSEAARLSALSRLYALATRLLLPPDPELFSALSSGAAFEAAAMAARHFGEGRMNEAAARLSAAFSKRPAADLAELSAQYEATYGQASSKDRPTCELWYGSALFREEQELADLCGYYRAFHVEKSEHAKERPDHAGIEAEFASFLAYLEAWAADQGREEQREAAGSALRSFVRDHLGTFTTPFAQRVQATAPEGLYRETAAFLAAVVDSHCEAFSIRRRERQFVEMPLAGDELAEPEGGTP